MLPFGACRLPGPVVLSTCVPTWLSGIHWCKHSRPDSASNQAPGPASAAERDRLGPELPFNMLAEYQDLALH